MSKWISTSLGEVAKIITGPFGTQLHKSDYVDSGVAVIMPQNIGSRQVNYEKISYISEEFATTLRRYKVLKTILFLLVEVMLKTCIYHRI